MVAKISHGASLYGALHYNHEKIEKGTAEILSGNRMISDRPGKQEHGEARPAHCTQPGTGGQADR